MTSLLERKNLKSATESRTWLLVALFGSLLAALPLLATPGLVSTRGGGDSPWLLIRTYEMAQALRGGQFPVRWMSGAAYGLGYPFFSFYTALPYYLAALLHLWGLGILWSIKLTQLIGFLAAAAGMYALARRWLDGPPAAALAAVAYTFAPFHLVNVYVRGDSLSEFYAFVWYPLILLSLHRLFVRPSAGRAGTLAVTFAALIVTHNLSAMLFGPFVLLYGLLLVFDRSIPPQNELAQSGATRPRNSIRSDRVRDPTADHGSAGSRGILTHFTNDHGSAKSWAIGLALLALALGMLLSAWYWLPVVSELGAVQLGEAQTTGYFHYSSHFRRGDLVQPTVPFDYDPDAAPTPFAMGLVQAALTLAGVVALVWRWLRRHRLDASGPWAQGSRVWYSAAGPRVLALLTLAITTLMITPLSQPLWAHLPLLPLTQFPWRFLSVQALATSLIIGVLATALPRPRWVAALAGLMLAAAALVGLHPESLAITDADVTPQRMAVYEYFTANVGTTIQAEYLPRQAVPRPYTSEALLAVPSRPTPMLLEGALASTTLLEHRPRQERWQIDVASKQARLAFHRLYFPGWQAQVDGQPVKVESWPGLGYVSLALEQGSHQIVLSFGRSPVRRTADLATVAGVVILIGIGMATRPWQRLARRHVWMMGGAIAVILAGGALLHLIAPSVTLAGPSDLTMDFGRQPYLHHNPAGVDFGATRLLHYTLKSDHLAAGDTVSLDITWADGGEETLTAQVDVVLAVHKQLERPFVLDAGTAAIPLGGGTTHHAITVPTDAVRGIYFLRVRVIGLDGSLAPRTTQGKPLGSTYLCPLWVTAYRPATGDEPVLGQFGPYIVLVDARVEPVDESRLSVTLTWRCDGQVPANYGLSLRMSDADGMNLFQYDTQPQRGLYPTAMWQPGELVTERHTLALDGGKTVEQAQTLSIILYDFGSPTLAPVGVAYVPVQERPRSFDLPPVQTPVGAEFGQQMRLLGYDLDQIPGALTLVLHWQAMQAMTTDYKVFVHLFDPATETIAVQDDAMPLHNTYPTRWWAKDEVVSDAITLSLADVPPGQYRLAIGVYDPATDDRLEAVDHTGTLLPANRLILEPQIERKNSRPAP